MKTTRLLVRRTLGRLLGPGGARSIECDTLIPQRIVETDLPRVIPLQVRRKRLRRDLDRLVISTVTVTTADFNDRLPLVEGRRPFIRVNVLTNAGLVMVPLECGLLEPELLDVGGRGAILERLEASSLELRRGRIHGFLDVRPGRRRRARGFVAFGSWGNDSGGRPEGRPLDAHKLSGADTDPGRGWSVRFDDRPALGLPPPPLAPPGLHHSRSGIRIRVKAGESLRVRIGRLLGRQEDRRRRLGRRPQRSLGRRRRDMGPVAGSGLRGTRHWSQDPRHQDEVGRHQPGRDRVGHGQARRAHQDDQQSRPGPRMGVETGPEAGRRRRTRAGARLIVVPHAEPLRSVGPPSSEQMEKPGIAAEPPRLPIRFIGRPRGPLASFKTPLTSGTTGRNSCHAPSGWPDHRDDDGVASRRRFAARESRNDMVYR